MSQPASSVVERVQIAKGKYHIWTVGCQMNMADSQRVSSILDSLGWEEAPAMDQANLVVLNTCSVREQPEKRAHGQLSLLRHAKRSRADLLVAMMGCMVGNSAPTCRTEGEVSRRGPLLQGRAGRHPAAFPRRALDATRGRGLHRLRGSGRAAHHRHIRRAPRSTYADLSPPTLSHEERGPEDRIAARAGADSGEPASGGRAGRRRARWRWSSVRARANCTTRRRMPSSQDTRPDSLAPGDPRLQQGLLLLHRAVAARARAQPARWRNCSSRRASWWMAARAS